MVRTLGLVVSVISAFPAVLHSRGCDVCRTHGLEINARHEQERDISSDVFAHEGDGVLRRARGRRRVEGDLDGVRVVDVAQRSERLADVGRRRSSRKRRRRGNGAHFARMMTVR